LASVLGSVGTDAPTLLLANQSTCWRVNRTKIRPELTFPLTHTMPL
jgi:hypothetical protein